MADNGLDLELCCANEDLQALHPTARTRRWRIAVLVSLTLLGSLGVAAATAFLQLVSAS